MLNSDTTLARVPLYKVAPSATCNFEGLPPAPHHSGALIARRGSQSSMKGSAEWS